MDKEKTKRILLSLGWTLLGLGGLLGIIGMTNITAAISDNDTAVIVCLIFAVPMLIIGGLIVRSHYKKELGKLKKPQSENTDDKEENFQPVQSDAFEEFPSPAPPADERADDGESPKQ